MAGQGWGLELKANQFSKSSVCCSPLTLTSTHPEYLIILSMWCVLCLQCGPLYWYQMFNCSTRQKKIIVVWSLNIDWCMKLCIGFDWYMYVSCEVVAFKDCLGFSLWWNWQRPTCVTDWAFLTLTFFCEWTKRLQRNGPRLRRSHLSAYFWKERKD